MGAGVCLRECNVTNPARNAPPYCHLRPLSFHHIFRHYLINGTIIGGGWKRLHVKYTLFLSDFNKTWIFSTYFRKSSNYKLHHSIQWEPSYSTRTDRQTDRPTDGHDEANSNFWKFCERTQKLLHQHNDQLSTVAFLKAFQCTCTAVTEKVCYILRFITLYT